MQQYRQFLSEGRLMLQRSRSKGHYIFYPRVLLPGSGEQDLDWVEARGFGRVYAVTTLFPRGKSPYCIAVVELIEGPRVMATVVGIDPARVAIGLRVRIVFDSLEELGDDDSGLRLAFRPVDLPVEEQPQ